MNTLSTPSHLHHHCCFLPTIQLAFWALFNHTSLLMLQVSANSRRAIGSGQTGRPGSIRMLCCMEGRTKMRSTSRALLIGRGALWDAMDLEKKKFRAIRIRSLICLFIYRPNLMGLFSFFEYRHHIFISFPILICIACSSSVLNKFCNYRMLRPLNLLHFFYICTLFIVNYTMENSWYMSNGQNNMTFFPLCTFWIYLFLTQFSSSLRSTRCAYNFSTILIGVEEDYSK